MYLIIVGGGAVARHIVALAVERGDRVTVIEKNKSRARKILQEHDVRVLNADINQKNLLNEAEADHADVMIATTEDDSVNLMAMILGKEREIEQLVTIIQNSEHQGMFEKLGVRVLSNPEQIVAKQLYGFVDRDKTK